MSQHRVAKKATGTSNDNGLLERLQRVEELLLRLDAKVSQSSGTPTSSSAYHMQQPTPQSTVASSQQHVPPATETETAHRVDTHMLENVGTSEHALVSTSFSCISKLTFSATQIIGLNPI